MIPLRTHILFQACIAIIFSLSANIFPSQLLAQATDAPILSSRKLKATSNTNKKKAKVVEPTIFQHLCSEKVEAITIEANLEKLYELKKKGSKDEAKAKLSYTTPSGTTQEFNVKLEARGKTRRRICGFPPLKVSFSKKSLDGNSLLGKHRKLKLVTHCNGDELDQQNVIKEYLAYKAFNLVTDNSFKTKLVKIKYKDKSGEAEDIDTYAFFIEDEDELGDRLGGKSKDLWGLEHDHFEKEVFQTFSLFQYMIGNTDWRTTFIHNIALIQSKTDTTSIIPVPYDFDYSGLVNSYYGKPNPNLKQENIKQRLCFAEFKDEAEAQKRLIPFLKHKEAILALYNNEPLLNKTSRKQSVKYLKSFFKMAEKKLKKMVEESNENHYRVQT